MKETSVKSTCCYCGVGCGVIIKTQANGNIMVEGDKDHPVNKGMLCSKGLNLHYTVNDQSDRLLVPQMRFNRSMPMQNVSWDTALDRTAAIFKSFIEQYGPESVGFYVSGQCLTEEYYLWNKLMKGFIGANNIDTNSRLCMSSAVVAYKMSLGEDIVPVCYDDIELTDVILVEGGNPAWCHPILWRRVEAHKEKNPNVKVIIVDPRITESVSIADMHLQINPGSDVSLNFAIARVLIESGKIDSLFLKNHTEGFESFKNEVMSQEVSDYALECGIDEGDIIQLAAWIGDAKGFLSMWTMGLNQSVVGVNKNLSLINLSLITGKIGKPGNGPFSLTGQPNAMGGREVGGLANMLASHRDYAIPEHRQYMQEFWGGNEISSKPGLTATEMIDALESGKMKAIWIACTNPMVSLPNSKKVQAALKKAKLVVVQEVSKNAETLDYADVILPAAAWAEKTGSMTNAERRITLVQKAKEAPGIAKPDAEIICLFAEKMGWKKSFDYKNAADIYAEYVKTTAKTNIDISNISYEIILENGSIQWPYLQENTARPIINNSFFTANKKAYIHTFTSVNHAIKPSSEFPLILTTGRLRDQWHTMTKTGKVNKLKQHTEQAFVYLHPDDAVLRFLKDNDIVKIKSKQGNAQLKLKLSESIKKGTCFMPMHWGKIMAFEGLKANNLIGDFVDAKSKEPDFKYTPVEISKYIKTPEKIIVVGAGSASMGFIQSHRSLNVTDEIEVFSKEKDTFYNRIMLPDYINGTQTWDQLLKLRDQEFDEFNIKVHKGVGIKYIDKKNKVVIDDLDQEHYYDKLFLGTGSRAFMPKNFPDIAGIFNMRSRVDADTLAQFLKPKAKVIVVGGGLLGLELAAALAEMKIEVIVIQRISRLMDRQLDLLASEILNEELQKRSIEFYYNDEVEQFYGYEKIESIRLKSGRKLDCDAIIVAAGTIPNIELAMEAGLICKRGVSVNAYMQTSDADIFACGEIAEFDNNIWGITAAAEQQAEVVANYLNGELASFYKGTLSINILKIPGLSISSMGIIEVPQNSQDYEEVIFVDKAKHYYKKCIIKDDRLVGAILIGDKTEFIDYKNLIANGIELSEKRLQLLRTNQTTEHMQGKLVCACNSVGDENIKSCIKKGAKSIDEIMQKTAAGTGCGSCKSEIKKIMIDCFTESKLAII